MDEQNINATFEVDKVTPGTKRFKEITAPGERGKIGSIYVLKSELEKIGNPDRIVVFVQSAE